MLDKICPYPGASCLRYDRLMVIQVAAEIEHDRHRCPVHDPFAVQITGAESHFDQPRMALPYLRDLNLRLAKDDVAVHALLAETGESCGGTGFVVLGQSRLEFGVGAFFPGCKEKANIRCRAARTGLDRARLDGLRHTCVKPNRHRPGFIPLVGLLETMRFQQLALGGLHPVADERAGAGSETDEGNEGEVFHGNEVDWCGTNRRAIALTFR